MSIHIPRDIPVTPVDELPTEPAMPPRLELPEDMKPDRVQALLHQSGMWKLGDWSEANLVLSRAALKHMLSLVEKEMGQRKMMSGPRGVERDWSNRSGG